MISTGNSVVIAELQDGLVENLNIWDINNVSFNGIMKAI